MSNSLESALVTAHPHLHPDNANLPTTNQAATILGVTISFLFVAFITLCLRLWVRFRDRLWGWDDAFVLLACLTSIAGDSMVCLMPADGLGLHLWTLDEGHRAAYFRHVYTTNIAYCASSALIKLSIMFQFLRLFAESCPSHRSCQYRIACRLTWLLIIITTIWGIVFFFIAIFPCRPIEKNWYPSMEGQCFGWGSKDPDTFFPMFLGHSVSNSVLDIAVLALPAPFLGMLRLAGKGRAGLITLYTLGCIVGAAAIGRMIALSINRAGTIPIFDMTYYIPLVYIFAVLEVNIAIMAASIPIFWPVMANLASGKIFVVNEVEIHVESASRGSFGSGRAIDINESKDAYSGRQSRISITAKTYNDRRRSRSSHRHKQSDGSSVNKNLGHRPSQDSNRSLFHKVHLEPKTLSGILPSEEENWFADLDRMHPGKTTTTVQRTDIPLEQIKAFEDR
ncbi:hypothetical protein IAQ61_001510 [Plenodomus lingam]|uniref:Rhodopsin domain-containing protein n=1 Tax=Leptosphaeria maculans (strain JN3 / isolate v23.1.3 / race Av1-4-5-6-7-8) TaxID=985895 RepID=E4ZY96_LEPMJ|nr:hypothetical protein LEMA_P112600.1 [Plenodomus lingam JN3]KAH9879691.1 hypothetical protein IAQ61_001510 [Plenodomus lingam]CBX96341.1 hypothetical protein LEMA_P112600.1 [Plenodomus lingam JN3]